MIVDKDGYKKIQNEISVVVQNLVSQDELTSFNTHIEKKLKDFKPTLIIYGVYNAGKSTLLNALFGKDEMAKTGDIPETKQVHEYTYNGYTIFDTPGLNANNKDDITSQQHLNKSELILFVMSNDGSIEEKYVYEKISEIVKSKKPIIIVINNKSGIDMNSAKSLAVIDKVGKNLRKIGDRNNIKNIETKVSICQVNAKTALKSKIENKNILLKKSNILELENMIEDVLDKSGTKEVINALNLYISNFVNSVISKIDNKIDNVEVKKTEELITYLEKFKKSSEVKLKNIVSSNISTTFIETITAMVLDGNDNINLYIESTIGTVNSEAMNISKYIESELATRIDGFTKEICNLNTEYRGVELIKTDNSSDKDSLIPDNVKNILKEKLNDKRVIEEGTKQVLFKAKELLPKEVMYGKGPVWMGKAAGRAAIAVNVALEVYNVYSANKEHEKMIEEKRNRVLSARHSAESTANSIQNSLFSSIDELVAETFNELILGYRNVSKQLGKDNNSLLLQKDQLSSILNKI